MVVEEFCNLDGVFVVALQAQGKGVDALDCSPCVECGEGGAGVAQKTNANLEAEGWCTKVCVLQSVVSSIWSDEVGENWLSILFDSPIELSAVDKHAAQSGAVAGVELGEGSDDNVCAELERAHERCGSDGVVDDQWNAVAVCNFSHRRNVQDVCLWVGESLAEECLGVWLNGCLPGLRIVGVFHEGNIDTQAVKSDKE